jgi:hypothetical protein
LDGDERFGAADGPAVEVDTVGIGVIGADALLVGESVTAGTVGAADSPEGEVDTVGSCVVGAGSLLGESVAAGIIGAADGTVEVETVGDCVVGVGSLVGEAVTALVGLSVGASEGCGVGLIIQLKEAGGSSEISHAVL